MRTTGQLTASGAQDDAHLGSRHLGLLGLLRLMMRRLAILSRLLLMLRRRLSSCRHGGYPKGMLR